MRRARVALALGVLLAALAAPPPGSAALEPALQITTRLDPATLVPGTQATLTVDVANLNNITAYNLRLEVSHAPEGINIEGDRATFGSVGSLKTTSAGLTLKVAEDTDPGRYLARYTLRYCYDVGLDDECDTIANTLPIQVRDPQDLRVTSVEPARLVRGESTDLVVTLHNPTKTTLEDLVVSWDAAGVEPLGKDDRVTIDTVAPKSSVSASFPVIVSPSAPSGPLPITLQATYNDVAANPRTVTYTTGVVVRGAVLFDAGDARYDGERFTLTVGNIGGEGATSVVVRALDAQGDVVGTTFLGTMDPGDFATIAMDVTKQAESIRIAYTDALGARHDQDMDVATRDDTPAPGNGEIPWAWIAGGVAVVIVAIAVVRWRR